MKYHRGSFTGTEGEKAVNNNEAERESAARSTETFESGAEAWRAQRRLRMEAVASANAAGLLCDLVLNGCAGDACTTRYVARHNSLPIANKSTDAWRTSFPRTNACYFILFVN